MRNNNTPHRRTPSSSPLKKVKIKSKKLSVHPTLRIQRASAPHDTRMLQKLPHVHTWINFHSSILLHSSKSANPERSIVSGKILPIRKATRTRVPCGLVVLQISNHHCLRSHQALKNGSGDGRILCRMRTLPPRFRPGFSRDTMNKAETAVDATQPNATRAKREQGQTPSTQRLRPNTSVYIECTSYPRRASQTLSTDRSGRMMPMMFLGPSVASSLI